MILYKYVSFESGFKILCNGTIGFTHLKDFNDPFESTAFGFVDREIGSKNNQNNAFKNKFSEKYAVLSLTKDPLNALMWAHYGDSHKGMVIGIDVNEAGFNTDDFIIKATDGEMVYLEKEPFNDYVPRTQDVENIGNDDYFSLYSPKKDLFKRAFLNKQECWLYEQEVRIVKNLGNLNLLNENNGGESDYTWSKVMNGYNPLYLFYFPKTAIKEVYLGKNTETFLDKEYVHIEQHKILEENLYIQHIDDEYFRKHMESSDCDACKKLYPYPSAPRSKFSNVNTLCKEISVELQRVEIDFDNWKLKARPFSF